MPRRRWLLLIACLAAVAIAVVSWQLSGPRERFTREQYGHIRLGMTPADVALVMGGPSRGERRGGRWDTVDREGPPPPSLRVLPVDKWVDETVAITVVYSDGDARAIWKNMTIRVPPWKVKARNWLNWLRRVVGW